MLVEGPLNTGTAKGSNQKHIKAEVTHIKEKGALFLRFSAWISLRAAAITARQVGLHHRTSGWNNGVQINPDHFSFRNQDSL